MGIKRRRTPPSAARRPGVRRGRRSRATAPGAVAAPRASVPRHSADHSATPPLDRLVLAQREHHVLVLAVLHRPNTLKATFFQQPHRACVPSKRVGIERTGLLPLQEKG